MYCENCWNWFDDSRLRIFVEVLDVSKECVSWGPETAFCWKCSPKVLEDISQHPDLKYVELEL